MAQYKEIFDNVFSATKRLSSTLFQNGKFVSFGYVKTESFSVGKSWNKVTPEFDQALSDYISSLRAKNTKLSNTLANALTEWQKDNVKYKESLEYDGEELAKERRSTLGFTNDKFQIISVTRYICNWRDRASLRKQYAIWRQGEEEIRGRHGFGRAADTYPEDDWHRKKEYGGIGLERKTQAQLKFEETGVAPREKTWKDEEEEPFGGFYARPYSDYERDDNGNLIFSFVTRQIPMRSILANRKYYFVNDDGDLFPIDDYFMQLLNATLNTKIARKVQAVTNAMTQEEIDFITEIKQSDTYNQHADDFSFNNILFMCGANEDGEKFIYNNSKYLGKVVPTKDKEKPLDYLNVNDLNDIVIDLTNATY